MKVNTSYIKSTGLSALFLFLFQVCYCISVYEVNYKFDNDETIYEALIVRQDNGGGFIRVHYSNKEGDFIVNMDFVEEYGSSKTFLNFKGQNPMYIKGSSSYNPDYFWFKKDDVTGKYNTHSVSSPGTDGKTTWGKINTFKLLNLKNISQNFALKFFYSTEAFYKNNFVDLDTYNYTNDKGTFHLIMVTATDDNTIGNSCKAEEREVLEYFKEIAKQSNLTLNSTILHGSTFTKTQVQNTLSNLYPSKNDVVFFYYGGHGFRFDNDTDPYPRLSLRNSNFDMLETNNLQLSEIYNIIKQKGARLNLIIGDCCNSYAGLPRYFWGGANITQRSTNTLSVANCKKLFREYSGNIIATAATKGQYALCYNDYFNGGGIYTKSFLSSLDYYLSVFNANPSWDNVFQKASSLTQGTSSVSNCGQTVCKHDPIFYTNGNTTTYSEPITNNSVASATIEKVWVDHNIFNGTLKGMNIHIKFKADNMKDKVGRVVAYFKYANGTALKDNNNSYNTKGGNVACFNDFTPIYSSSIFTDYVLFMPYDELHLESGKTSCKFKIEIQQKNTSNNFLISSEHYFFDYNKN